VLDVGQRRDQEAGSRGGRLTDRVRGETKHVGARLRQPDGAGLRCGESRVSESSRDPTPPR
jgi:hypothetical protein